MTQKPVTSIREERASDAEAILDLTRVAFEHHPYGDHSEHFIVNALRAAGALTVSLVAEAGGRIVGHVAFSPVTISDGSVGWYELGPVSVLPGLQRRGIGEALIHEGLSRLKSLGAKGCVLLGDSEYYGRFGFANDPALTLAGVPQEFFLALAFEQSPARGSVRFHEAFSSSG